MNVAAWKLKLMAECPACEEYVDLLDEPDFWENHEGLIACENGTPRSMNVAVYCPNCRHQFHVLLEY